MENIWGGGGRSGKILRFQNAKLEFAVCAKCYSEPMCMKCRHTLLLSACKYWSIQGFGVHYTLLGPLLRKRSQKFYYCYSFRYCCWYSS